MLKSIRILTGNVMYRKVEEFNPWDLVEKMEDEGTENFVILDVREVVEYIGDLGHIKHSINVPISELEARLSDLQKYSQKHMVMVCSSGERSYFACQYLMDHGFSDVSHIRGGLIQWHLSGLDVIYGRS